MKVLLNIDAVVPPLTGIGHYTRQLLIGLRASPRCELHCFSQMKIFNDSCDPLKQLNSVGKQRSYASLRHAARKIPGAYQARSLMRDSFFKLKIDKQYTDAIYHEPNYILKPFTGVSISTVHDLSWIHYPQFHPRERVRYMEREIPKTIERATHFITDSDYVKNEMVSILSVDSERISTIPLGVGAEFNPQTEAGTMSVLNKYDLCFNGYLLAVATLEPRKNLEGLLDAYMRLSATLRRRFPLVLVGGKGWNSKTLEKKLEKVERSGDVRRLGYVVAHELPLIYAAARAFAFPSFYEGFGLPPLEAMASGVPVLTSNNSAMSEVVGEAGILIDAEENDSIFRGLEQLLTDKRLRKNMIERGLIRAQKFSWQRCVKQTIDLYEKVALENSVSRRKHL